jgi:L-threonylcarbamoyladenylate synthase
VAHHDLKMVARQLADADKAMALIHYSKHDISGSAPGSASSLALPADAGGYAHGLYAALRAMDGVAADVIVVELPPADAAWQGVNDRLRRAAFDSRAWLSALIPQKK